MKNKTKKKFNKKKGGTLDNKKMMPLKFISYGNYIDSEKSTIYDKFIFNENDALIIYLLNQLAVTATFGVFNYNITNNLFGNNFKNKENEDTLYYLEYDSGFVNNKLIEFKINDKTTKYDIFNFLIVCLLLKNEYINSQKNIKKDQSPFYNKDGWKTITDVDKYLEKYNIMLTDYIDYYEKLIKKKYHPDKIDHTKLKSDIDKFFEKNKEDYLNTKLKKLFERYTKKRKRTKSSKKSSSGGK